MNCVRLLGVSLFVAVAICEINSVPVGGYPDSLQNLEYGPPGHKGGKGGYDDGKNEPANYDFQYEVFGGGNFFGHQESRRDVKTTGKYHVLLPDGRKQTVDYFADESGYHPTITYELVGNGDGGYGGGNSGGSGYSVPAKPSSGYGTPAKPSGDYGAPQNPSSDYGAPQSPSSGYGAPADNTLGGNRYSSRAKRQHSEEGQFDLVRVYRPESNPEMRFRNRRRRFSPKTPKKMYLIVYPDGTSSLKQESKFEGSIEK